MEAETAARQAARTAKSFGAGEAAGERREKADDKGQTGHNGQAAGHNGHEAGERGETTASRQPELGIGDVVWIPSLGRRGVVYRLADERGNLIVQVHGVKQLINRKRVQLQIESRHLYPDDYDMNIVFDSVDNRKKRSLMGKRHVEGLKIERKELE